MFKWKIRERLHIFSFSLFLLKLPIWGLDVTIDPFYEIMTSLDKNFKIIAL